jgi:uncharacterized protein
MDAQTLMLVIVAIVGAACLLQSTVGFGSALLAMPLLVPLIGLRTATPLIGLCTFVLGVIVIVRDRAQIDLRAARVLIAASVIGVPFGLLLLRAAPESIMLHALGVLLIAYAAYNLSNARLPASDHPAAALLLGFVSGVLGGAYNTNGPPLVIYGQLKRWPPGQFRATLQGVFFFANIAIVFGQYATGLWTVQVWTYFAWSLPMILAATFLGGWLNTRIPRERFALLVYALLIVFGVLLLLR